jgi:hypothetical protein
MSDPTFVLDNSHRLWQLAGNEYRCIESSPLAPPPVPRYSLTELSLKYGPLHHIEKGHAVAISEIIDDGSWVEFDVVSPAIYGQVRSYDISDATYEVLVKIGRDKVRKVDVSG